MKKQLQMMHRLWPLNLFRLQRPVQVESSPEYERKRTRPLPPNVETPFLHEQDSLSRVVQNFDAFNPPSQYECLQTLILAAQKHQPVIAFKLFGRYQELRRTQGVATEDSVVGATFSSASLQNVTSKPESDTFAFCFCLRAQVTAGSSDRIHHLCSERVFPTAAELDDETVKVTSKAIPFLDRKTILRLFQTICAGSNVSHTEKSNAARVAIQTLCGKAHQESSALWDALNIFEQARKNHFELFSATFVCLGAAARLAAASPDEGLHVAWNIFHVAQRSLSKLPLGVYNNLFEAAEVSSQPFLAQQYALHCLFQPFAILGGIQSRTTSSAPAHCTPSKCIDDPAIAFLLDAASASGQAALDAFSCLRHPDKVATAVLMQTLVTDGNWHDIADLLCDKEESGKIRRSYYPAIQMSTVSWHIVNNGLLSAPKEIQARVSKACQDSKIGSLQQRGLFDFLLQYKYSPQHPSNSDIIEIAEAWQLIADTTVGPEVAETNKRLIANVAIMQLVERKVSLSSFVRFVVRVRENSNFVADAITFSAIALYMKHLSSPIDPNRNSVEDLVTLLRWVKLTEQASIDTDKKTDYLSNIERFENNMERNRALIIIVEKVIDEMGCAEQLSETIISSTCRCLFEALKCALQRGTVDLVVKCAVTTVAMTRVVRDEHRVSLSKRGTKFLRLASMHPALACSGETDSRRKMEQKLLAESCFRVLSSLSFSRKGKLVSASEVCGWDLGFGCAMLRLLHPATEIPEISSVVLPLLRTILTSCWKIVDAEKVQNNSALAKYLLSLNMRCNSDPHHAFDFKLSEGKALALYNSDPKSYLTAATSTIQPSTLSINVRAPNIIPFVEVKGLDSPGGILGVIPFLRQLTAENPEAQKRQILFGDLRIDSALPPTELFLLRLMSLVICEGPEAIEAYANFERAFGNSASNRYVPHKVIRETVHTAVKLLLKRARLLEPEEYARRCYGIVALAGPILHTLSLQLSKLDTSVLLDLIIALSFCPMVEPADHVALNKRLCCPFLTTGRCHNPNCPNEHKKDFHPLQEHRTCSNAAQCQVGHWIRPLSYPGNKYTINCCSFLRGECRWGSNCRAGMHDRSQREHATIACQWGSQCRFGHWTNKKIEPVPQKMITVVDCLAEVMCCVNLPHLISHWQQQSFKRPSWGLFRDGSEITVAFIHVLVKLLKDPQSREAQSLRNDHELLLELVHLVTGARADFILQQLCTLGAATVAELFF